MSAPQPPAEAQAQGGGEVDRWEVPPCVECGAVDAKDAETKCICAGDKDDCHGCHLWPDGDTAPPSAPVGVCVDFPQVGTAGPFAVVDGKVTLPDTTMNDLIRHARTGYVKQPAPVGVEAICEQLVQDWKARERMPMMAWDFRGFAADAILRFCAQQPAADGGFTAADMMDARQEGWKEAQQPAAVDGNWRKKAAEWLEAKAVEQEANNQRWPDHAAAYKEWRDRPGVLRILAAQVLAAQPGGA